MTDKLPLAPMGYRWRQILGGGSSWWYPVSFDGKYILWHLGVRL